MAAKQGQNGSSEAGGVGPGQPEEIQRWTAARKAAVALDIIKGKATPQDVARQYDLTVLEVEGWVEKFLESGREGLRAVPRDLEARFEAEKKDLLAKVGELTLQVDALKKKTSSPSPSSLSAASGQAQSW
jgi:transposase-like protein